MAIRLTGIASGMDTDAMVKELVSAYSLKKETYEKQKTKLEWKQDAWKELNSSIYKFYTSSLSSMRRMASFTNKKNCVVSDSTKATVTANGKVPNGTQTIEVKELAQAAYLTGGAISKSSGTKIENVGTKLSELGIPSGRINIETASGTKQFLINTGESIEEFTTRFKEETGVDASFDVGQQRFIFTSESGKDNNFNFTVETDDDFNTLAAMGLATKEQHIAHGTAEADIPKNIAYKQNASDAQIVVNGALYETASNTITVNGLTVTATGKTTGPITVTTSQDTDGIYDMVKGFFKEYNDLMNKMTEFYNASSSKGYEPLTDEEKDAMSESEIEKWEKKIKDSLFRRDDRLDSIMNSMITSMSRGFEVDGKTYHLSNFGIGTEGFMNAEKNKHNAYHINGDPDDSRYADKTDKLKSMIEDPDMVAGFFNKLATGLYDTLSKRMSENKELSSALTIYNDKQMKKDMLQIEKNISDWEKKVKDYEDYWYNKFSAMETALSKLQSQTSQLTSLLGGGGN